jgi:hypothetical protein
MLLHCRTCLRLLCAVLYTAILSQNRSKKSVLEEEARHKRRLDEMKAGSKEPVWKLMRAEQDAGSGSDSGAAPRKVC